MDLMTNCNTTAGSTPVTYSAIKHYINSTIHDPPPQHARTASVYSHDTLHTDTSLSRRDQVLLAQLRSSHCHKLAAYHNVIDPTADPSCRKCSLASHTLEHWLQECPATASQRFQILGEADLHLCLSWSPISKRWSCSRGKLSRDTGSSHSAAAARVVLAAC